MTRDLPAAVEQFSEPFSPLEKEQAERVLAICEAGAPLGGNFPTSNELIQALRRAGGDHLNSTVLSRMVSLDPLTSLRLIALCNQSLYSRGEPILDIERAVQHVGFVKLPELVSDFSIGRAYGQNFRGRGLAGIALQDALFFNILALRFSSIESGKQNFGARRAMSLRMIPELMLAYYAPGHFAAISLDVLRESRGSFERSFRRLFGVPFSQYAERVTAKMNLPKPLADYVAKSDIAPWNRRSGELKKEGFSHTAAFLANRIGREIVSFRESHIVTNSLREVESKMGLARQRFQDALSGITAEFVEVTSLFGLTPARLPAFLTVFDDKMIDAGEVVFEQKIEWPRSEERLRPFLLELKTCLQAQPREGGIGYFPQAVLVTLQALVRALDFDRAVFLHRQDRVLRSLMVLGKNLPDGQEVIVREPREIDFQPDFKALFTHEAVFSGDPIIGEDWPLAAFPLVWRGESIGVFYADRRADKNALPLSTSEQVGVLALADKWQELPDEFF